MSSAAPADTPTRGAVFEPLIAVAKARIVTFVELDRLTADDGEFLLRALIDLESDGIELFGPAGPADAAFYGEISDYLVARVGTIAVETSVVAPESAEAIAALGASEGRRVSQLLGLPQAAPCGRNLDRSMLQLIEHQGGRR
jgi:hypothetical protein